MNIKSLPVIEDDFEAACYRALLKLIVPELRKNYASFRFNWPVEIRGSLYWTACAITPKSRPSVLGVIYGSAQRIIIDFDYNWIASTAIADPDCDKIIYKCISAVLQELSETYQI